MKPSKLELAVLDAAEVFDSEARDIGCFGHGLDDATSCSLLRFSGLARGPLSARASRSPIVRERRDEIGRPSRAAAPCAHGLTTNLRRHNTVSG
jgi:hypothetical protein